ncbi:hypothetical protein ACOMHN_058530 [Nucella lapillus]
MVVVNGRNKVAPASPSRQGPSGGLTGSEAEPESPLAKAPAEGPMMPAVEDTVLDRGLAPRPGGKPAACGMSVTVLSLLPWSAEKLHTPLQVDRTYRDYDPDGLITWSPYRASDESARIVLPEPQMLSAKAPAQEKLHTTVFMELATAQGPQPRPAPPPVLRAKQPPPRAEASLPSGAADTQGQTAGGGPPGVRVRGAGRGRGELEPPTHKPPTRNVGTRDERDFISASVGAGHSAKQLVDSIRQELRSLSGKLPPPEEAGKGEGGRLRRGELSGAPQTVANGTTKPLKKPRKSSYLDST